MRDTVTAGNVRDLMLSRNGIMTCRRLVVALLVFSIGLAWPAPLRGQAVDPEALESLYSLDFEPAEQKFRELTLEDPANPTYWNLLASSIWLKIVYEQEKLGLDSYTGSRLGGSGSTDIVNPEREARVRDAIQRAIEASEAILREDPQDLEALYAIGVAYGTLASFEALAKRAYLKANSAAKRAREYHMEVLGLDPSFNDARLSIGTYDYALGEIPGFLRFVLGFIGIRGGDTEGGIEQLEYAAELGDRASTNAKMVLVVVYNREEEYDKALAVLKDLHSDYPRNFLLELEQASVYGLKEEWDAAIAVYETVLRKVEAGTDDYDRLDAEPVLFKIGEANVHSHRNDRAIPAFTRVISGSAATAGLKARSHLWMGKMYDSVGERDTALEHYNAILALDSDDDLKNEARRFLRRPFSG